MSTQPAILVVDDEEIMREVITTLLEEEGYRVTSSATGEEGIEKVKEEAPDLVLLDLMLPSMSGLEALEEIIRIDSDVVVVSCPSGPHALIVIAIAPIVAMDLDQPAEARGRAILLGKSYRLAQLASLSRRTIRQELANSATPTTAIPVRIA